MPDRFGLAAARWWRHASSVDLRALAAFRVAFALVLLVDLALRMADLGAFYADGGVLPRELLIALPGFGDRFSLWLSAGSAWWAGSLMAVAWLAALALLLGWRTRTAVLLLFVLIGSLQSRNPFILIGADIQIMALLLWSLFLPLAARWSVDAAVSSRPPPQANRWHGVAAAALLLQVVSVYFFSAALKDGPAWWPDGTAVHYALELHRYSTGIGRWLQGFESLTQLLTWYVYALEWLAPLLVFAPFLPRRWWSGLRLTAMLLLMLMHLGFLLCLELGHFPYVSLAALLVLAPTRSWNALARRSAVPGARHIRIYYDRDCGFCLASCRLLRVFLILPGARILPAQDSVRADRLMQAHWSWVVIDASDTAHLKYDAMLALLRASPLLRWLAPLAALPPLHRAGTGLYDLVAGGRGRVAEGSRWLWASRPVRFAPGRSGTVLAAVLIVVVLFWNAATVGWIAPRLLQPVAPLVQTLRIDQRWDMFAPEPSRLDGWLIFPGQLEDGREVDVRRDGAALSWQRPQPPHGERNIRWHSYEWRLLALAREDLFNGYGRYLCRRYNRTAAPGERLLRFDMVYVLRHTPAPGEAAESERRTAWRHQCVARR